MGKFNVQDIAMKPLIAMFLAALLVHWVALTYVEKTSCAPGKTVPGGISQIDEEALRIIEHSEETENEQKSIPNTKLNIEDEGDFEGVPVQRSRRMKRTMRLASYKPNNENDEESQKLEMSTTDIIESEGVIEDPKDINTGDSTVAIETTEKEADQIHSEGKIQNTKTVKHFSKDVKRKKATTKIPFELSNAPVPKRMEREDIEKFNQLDTFLIDYVKTYHMYPPSKLSYNLKSIDDSTDRKIVADFIAEELNKKKNGIFVVIGVKHEALSETFYLEKTFQWSGLLIEGSPASFPILRMQHRKAWLSDVLISSLDYPKLVCYEDPKMNDVERGDQDPDEEENAIEGDGCNNKLISFPIRTLLIAQNISKIDLLAIYTTNLNWSAQILKEFPFTNIDVQIISIGVAHRQNENLIKVLVLVNLELQMEWLIDQSENTEMELMEPTVTPV